MVFDYKAYWEERGKIYMHQYGREGYISYAKKLVPVLKGLSGIKKILDIGCGFGRQLKVLSEVYPKAEIIGIDISPALLKEAEKYLTDCPNITLHLQDFHSYAPRGKFDLITEWACFCHVPPELIHNVSTQCHKLLRKKGGYMLLVDIPKGTKLDPKKPHYQWAYDYRSLFKDGFTLIKKIKNLAPGQDLFLFKKEES